MVKEEINFKEIIPKFDKILERGLCKGLGYLEGQMCIEAAICASMDLPFGDDPSCVAPAVRIYKIKINDKNWSSTQARAKALRDIGIAQIGSAGVVNDREFIKRLSTKSIQVLIPHLFRNLAHFKENQKIQNLVDLCEKDPTVENCRNLNATYAATYATYAAAYAAAATATYAASAAYAAAATADAAAAAAADAAAYVAAAEFKGDFYLIMSVNLALEVLKELKSPGCEWI